MRNKDKIQLIIDQQIEKLRDLSEKSKMPLNPADINSLTALAKLIDESDKLEKKEKNKADEFSPAELLLIYEHRKNLKK